MTPYPLITPHRPLNNTNRAFEDFWQAYPRKENRFRAITAFDGAVQRGADPAAILAGAKRLAAQNLGRFNPGAAKWLAEERWNDPPPLPHPAELAEQARQATIRRTRGAPL